MLCSLPPLIQCATLTLTLTLTRALARARALALTLTPLTPKVLVDAPTVTMSWSYGSSKLWISHATPSHTTLSHVTVLASGSMAVASASKYCALGCAWLGLGLGSGLGLGLGFRLGLGLGLGCASRMGSMMERGSSVPSAAPG